MKRRGASTNGWFGKLCCRVGGENFRKGSSSISSSEDTSEDTSAVDPPEALDRETRRRLFCRNRSIRELRALSRC